MKAFQKCNGNATDNWKAENASFHIPAPWHWVNFSNLEGVSEINIFYNLKKKPLRKN